MKRDAEHAADTPQRVTRFSELFASMVNHEMRNALSAMSTAASLIEMRADSDKIGTPARRITTSAARMERMLSQLVDFTRIELDGALVLIREPLELEEVARAVIDELPAEHRARVRLESEGETEGRWDRDRVCQLLSTLLANALQHGAQDAPVRVALRSEADERGERNVIVEVESQGAMTPEVLEGLFVPKRKPLQDRAPSGLGLGLYVAQHVAQAHGGRLEARSAKDRSRFVLQLPAQPIPTVRPAKAAIEHA